MRIGIDASRLSEENRTGTENYLYYLVKAIATYDTTNEYVLYFKNEPSTAFVVDLTNGNGSFSYKVLNKLGSWTQISLAMELFRDTPDVLFCPWHTIPGINPFWNMKTVSTIHDITGRFIPTWWTIMFSNKLIAVSNNTKQMMIDKFGASKSKIEVVYEGYEQGNFYRRSEEEIAAAKQKYAIKRDYAFFLGSLGPRKNIRNMVTAFNDLHTNAEFVLGGTPLPGENLLTKLPAKFIGRVAQKDLPALYSGAKFFAFVSKEEGFGVPILEAMACETPVLTSNISSMSEIAGDAALLVDPDSVDSIKEGMKRLLEDDTLVNTLVEKGVGQLKKFSWDHAARQTIQIFQKVEND